MRLFVFAIFVFSLFAASFYLIEKSVLYSYSLDPVRSDFIVNSINLDKNLRISDMNRITIEESLNGDYLSKIVRISTRPSCEKHNSGRVVCSYDLYRSNFISLFKDSVEFCSMGLDMCNETYRDESLGRLMIEYYKESRGFTIFLKNIPFKNEVIIDYLNFYMSEMYEFKMINENEIRFDLTDYSKSERYPELIKVTDKMNDLVEIYVYFK